MANIDIITGMKLFSWNDILDYLNTGRENPYFAQGCGISTGSFDGLHKGHRVLIQTLVNESKKSGLLAGVVTFKRPLPSIKHYSDYQGDISTLNQRLSLLEELGVDFAIVVDFDDSFASMLGADFFTILINACNMKLIAEGVDFRCGYKGATDFQAIRYFGQQNKIQTFFVNPVFYKEGTDEEERISSSYIRQMIHKGFLTTVNELLERPYQLDLREKVQVLPPDGIYHCKNADNADVRIEIKNGIVKTEDNSLLLKF